MRHLGTSLSLAACFSWLGCADAPVRSAAAEASRDASDAAAPLAPDGSNPQTTAQVDSPVPLGAERACPEANDPIGGKISDPEATLTSAGSHKILIRLVRSADLATYNQIPCTTRPCLEREAEGARLSAENLELQRCLRAWIDEVGASASDEAFFILNLVVAQATWEQVRLIAAHPDVLRIESDTYSAPPP